jgi:ABC-type oligopeptide transport system ATPase subunit
MTADALVTAQQLSCTYETQHGLRRPTIVRAVNNVDLTIRERELMALVGESGSGKSTLGRALVRLVRPSGGRVLFAGADIARLHRKKLIAFHGDAQIVFQNPYQSLNPRMTVGDTLGEVLAVWKKRRAGVADQRVEELLTMVHLPTHFAGKYPHELSGGQRQRVAIARAMAVRPRLLVADEPVSALDVSAAARVLNLLLELRERTDLTCLFITHDIGLARLVADRIAVMHVGSIVELGQPTEIFDSPRDEYTKTLIGAELQVGGVTPREPTSASVTNGQPPRARDAGETASTPVGT